MSYYNYPVSGFSNSNYRDTDFSSSMDSLFSESEDSPIKQKYYNDGNSSCSAESPLKKCNLDDTKKTKVSCRSLGNDFLMAEDVEVFAFAEKENSKAAEFMNSHLTRTHRIWKKVKDELPQHTQLRKDSKELKKSSEIKSLLHFNPSSDNAKDLYMSDKVVFKPGEEEAVMSKMGYMITWLAGLQGTVVPSKQGKATVISRVDQNDKGEDKPYVFVRMGSRLTIVDNTLLEAIDKKDKIPVTAIYEDDTISVKINDCIYSLSSFDDGFVITMPATEFEKLLEQEEFSQITDKDGEVFAAPSSQMLALTTRDGQDFVKIGGAYYEIVEDFDEEGIFTLEFATIEENEGCTADKGLLSKQYQEFLNFEGNAILVATTDYIAYDADEGILVTDGKSYEVEASQGTLTITRQEDDSDDDAFAKEHKNKQFLLVEQGAQTYLVDIDAVDEETLEEAPTVTQDQNGYMTVMRNNQPYQIEQTEPGINVIGKKIKGMVQSKVPNIFMGTKEKQGIVDIVKSSKEVKEAFYHRIPMNYYADALLASLLLRPQDGKIESLDESNVLFSAEANSDGKIDPQDPTCPLRPVLIDLDETMPANNAIFTTEKQEDVCAVRLGLMGFPHARRALEETEKTHILDKIKTIISAKESLITNLEAYSKKRSAKSFVKKENIQAFKSILSSLESFTKTQSARTDWNLQSLCFSVLPEYGRQWNEVMAINPEEIPTEKLASMIGKDPLNKIKDRMERSYHVVDAHK